MKPIGVVAHQVVVGDVMYDENGCEFEVTAAAAVCGRVELTFSDGYVESFPPLCTVEIKARLIGLEVVPCRMGGRVSVSLFRGEKPCGAWVISLSEWAAISESMREQGALVHDYV